MKMEYLEKASKLLKELKEVEGELATAKDAFSFKLEMKAKPDSYSWDYVGHCDGVSETASGSYGILATALRGAAVAYFEFHVGNLRHELSKLGVEIAA